MPRLKEKILITLPAFLISIIPLFLITGPFLSDLCVVLVCLFFLVNVVLNKDYTFFKNKFFFIFFIFFIFLLINSLIKFYDFHNLRSSLGYLRFGIFSLGVIYFIEKEQKVLR